MSQFRLAVLAVETVLLAACASPPAPPIQAPVAAPVFDTKSYIAAAQNMPVYKIDRSASNIWILVDVAGPLASLGHQHAIIAADLEGYALLAQTKLSADLRLPLGSLQVDQPEARRHLQLEGDLSRDAVSGTREHMLESLQVDEFPDLLVQIHELRTSGDIVMALGNLYLHGVIKPIAVPVDTSHSETELRVSGSFQIRQSEFGITPYNALNGGLRVADDLSISFSLIARRFTVE